MWGHELRKTTQAPRPHLKVQIQNREVTSDYLHNKSLTVTSSQRWRTQRITMLETIEFNKKTAAMKSNWFVI